MARFLIGLVVLGLFLSSCVGQKYPATSFDSVCAMSYFLDEEDEENIREPKKSHNRW